MRRIGLTLLAALALAGCDTSDPLGLYPEPPTKVVAPLPLTGRVTDAADILDAREEAVLTERLAEIEADTRAQLVVVTTPSLGGEEIDDYSLALGRGWGIGSAERDDGLLIVVAPNERRVRVEVGYGLETTVDDLYAKDVIDTMTPHFREERYYDGISVGIDRLGERLRAPKLKEAA